MKGKLARMTTLLLFCALGAPELLARDFNSNGNASVAAVVADFNKDGIPDLAIVNTWANHGSEVSVMLGDVLKPGDFLPPTLFPSGSGPGPEGSGAFFVTAADVNGDGNMDLVVANFGDSSVSVLLGNGMGRFDPPKNFRVGNFHTGVIVADFNRDGIPDIATANFGLFPGEEDPDCSGATDVDLTISVLIGEDVRPDVRFRPPINITVGCAPEGVYAADFNGDGYDDLIVTNFYGNTVALLLNDNGEFPDTPTMTFTPGIRGPAYGAVADLNQDGNLDFVTANWDSHNISVFLGDGSGNFEIRNFSTQDSPSRGKRPRSVVVGNFRNRLVDDNLDIATSNFESNDISILFGDGSGNFSSPRIIPLGPSCNPSDPGPRCIWFMTMGDFNGDGNLDFAVIRHGGVVTVLYGDGQGRFNE